MVNQTIETMNVLTKTRLNNFLSNIKFESKNPIQNEAYDYLSKLDFPTTRDEYWKYTRMNKIANATFNNGEVSNDNLNLDEYKVSEQFLIIENGIFRSDLSSFDLEQVNILVDSNENLEKTDANFDDLFQTLNTAFAEQTVYINIPKKVIWKQPVQIIYINTNEHTIANTRLVIEAAPFSEASVITTFVNGKEGSFNNHYTEIDVAENAIFNFDKIQISKGFFVATENVKQKASTTFKINTITLAGELVRNNLNIDVEGQNCNTFLNGAVITKDNQVIDNHTFVNHLVSNCMSDENYKYVLNDKSTGTFNGKVIVQQDAQKINAYQQNGNILLSDFAKINSKPELEIYADDVKCSHGSTTGQLDDDALFYLQTRGLSKDKARKLLVSAFVIDVLNEITFDPLRKIINDYLIKEFNWTID